MTHNTRDIRVALIGLDTSHTIEFAQRMQGPHCPDEQRVTGLHAVSCLRFETPFQNEAGLNARQTQLEGWGIAVTTDFDRAVAQCDAIMLEINDPALHWEYFQRCVALSKPIFLDKPLADTVSHGRKIVDLAEAKNVRVFSASSLRFVPALADACDAIPAPTFVHTYGPLGSAPAGSGVVWYGVHSFEMLQRAMGNGASRVTVLRDGLGVTCLVDYADTRRGLVELSTAAWVWGGELRTVNTAAPFVVNMDTAYRDLLQQVEAFFRTGQSPVALADTLEVMALLDAAHRASESGRREPVTSA